MKTVTSPNIQTYMAQAQEWADRTGQPLEMAPDLIRSGGYWARKNGELFNTRLGRDAMRKELATLNAAGHAFAAPWLDQDPEAAPTSTAAPAPEPVATAPAARPAKGQAEKDLRAQVAQGAARVVLDLGLVEVRWTHLNTAAEQLGREDHLEWYGLTERKHAQDQAAAQALVNEALEAQLEATAPEVPAEVPAPAIALPVAADPEPVATPAAAPTSTAPVSIKLDGVDRRAVLAYLRPDLQDQVSAAFSRVSPGTGPRLVTLPADVWEAARADLEALPSVPNVELAKQLGLKLGAASANASRRAPAGSRSHPYRILGNEDLHAELGRLKPGELGAMLAQALKIRQAGRDLPDRTPDGLAPNGRPRVNVSGLFGAVSQADLIHRARDAMRAAKWPYAEVETFTLMVGTVDGSDFERIMAAYTDGTTLAEQFTGDRFLVGEL